MRQGMVDLRRESGLTYNRIAEELDCAPSTVYFYETGKIDVTWYHLEKYIDLMGIKTIEELKRIMSNDGRAKVRN